MVLGYGDYKAEVIEYCVANRYEYKFIPSSGDNYADLMDIVVKMKQKELKFTKFIVYTERDFGSEEEYYYWIKPFVTRNIEIIIICGESDPRVAAMFRKVYKLRNVNRFKAAGLAHKLANKNKYQTPTKTPYGYVLKDGKYYENPEQLNAVRYYFRKKKEGATESYIVDQLNRMGYDNGHNKPIVRGTIQSWGKNHKFYEGYERTKDGWVRLHEPIINPDGSVIRGR